MTEKVRQFLKSSILAVLWLVFTVNFASGATGKSHNVTALKPASVAEQDAAGQSRTTLPDGRILLVGGLESGIPDRTAILQDSHNGTAVRISSVPTHTRAYHSATLLPNGKVLIFGGMGEGGSTAVQSELFDPAKLKFTLTSTGRLTSRSHHTATLLTDGRLMVAGGLDSGGKTLSSIELWDYRTGHVITLAVGLKTPRSGQTATLLRDGTVLLDGGVDVNGDPLDHGEIVDVNAPSTRFGGGPSDVSRVSAPPQLEASIPQSGQTGVSIDQLLALRFSKQMSVTTINATTINLRTSTESIAIDVMPSQDGMLAFVTPQALLQAGTTYVLSVSGATDQTGQRLPDVSILFTTAFPDDAGAGEGSSGSSGSNGWSGTGAAPSNPSGLNSEWRKLPMLPGPAGLTSLAGQVLKLDGTPLADVLVEIDSRSTSTDETGRFVVQDVGSGHHVLIVDGGTVRAKSASYGIYRMGVDLQAGKTNSLNYTIWMPALDTQHIVAIPSPTTSDTIISNPNLPGVELHIPPGTVIHDIRGKVVTRIGITPIPTNQAPFPLKRGVKFPVYFTIQPAGASFATPGNALSPNAPRPRGAQIFYENRYKAKPGAAFGFWNYDPTQKGWYVYGLGHVSSDGKMIVPDQNTQIYSFDGAMVALPSIGVLVGALFGNPKGGEPVDLQTGLFEYEKTDLDLKDVIPITLTRSYRQSDYISRAFGIGMNLSYDMYLAGDASDTPEGYTYQDLFFADGSKVHFTRTSPCLGTNGYCDYTNAVYTATSTPGPFYGATLVWNSGSPYTPWVILLKNGSHLYFPDANDATVWQQATLSGLQDRNGNSLTLTRDGNNNLTMIKSPNGRWIQFTYDSSNRIVAALDNIGRTTSYSYNTGGYLATAIDANGGTTSYTYDAGGNMLTITDPRGIVYLQNQYNVNDMVSQQTLANGGVYQFSYTLNSAGNVTQANVTDPLGYTRIVGFDADGYMNADTHAVGMPEVQSYEFNRQIGTGLVSGMTDPLNRQTTYTYDSMGNIASMTMLASTPSADTVSLSYTANFDQVASITDPLGNVTNASYDGNGNMVSVSDPLNETTSITYNGQGRPTTVIDPMGNETQLTYQGGMLSTVTDPLGRVADSYFDAAGRLVGVKDPLNNSRRIAYDPLNRVTSLTDPLGHQTLYTYDANGNLLTMSDPNGHINSYTYNNMDHIATETDGLGNVSTSQYDLSNNLTTYTDRKDQITSIEYDGIDRPKFFGYGTQPGPAYQNTVSYSFDAANRITSVTDSIGGTITRSYDGLNHILSESTPLGSIAYTYDADERRKSMTVSGQPQFNYTFDKRGQLLSINQGSTSVAFSYDSDGRRNSLTLPNGISVVYGYDAASEVTGILDTGASSTPANLVYSYDLDGRRIGVSGALAATQLPSPISSAVYNANNQLTTWGTTEMSYDADGNTLADGTNVYTWDARNRLISADSNGASFAYDGFGRRISKTMQGSNTSFVYDGVNPVQELSGGTVTANILSGMTDERFQRTDGSGSLIYLADDMDSTVALTSTTGATEVQYIYGPFGATTIGGDTTNSYTYTGREMDDIGVDYYRARYYNPGTGRFLSEDPKGLRGGINRYVYAGNDPINFRDPFGTDKCNPKPKEFLQIIQLANLSMMLPLDIVDGNWPGAWSAMMDILADEVLLSAEMNGNQSMEAAETEAAEIESFSNLSGLVSFAATGNPFLSQVLSTVQGEYGTYNELNGFANGEQSYAGAYNMAGELLNLALESTDRVYDATCSR